MGTTGEWIKLQVDSEQKELLEAACKVEQTGVSAFILSAAMVAAASDVLADRRTFGLDEDAWAAFDAAVNRPAGDVAGLRQLLSEPTVLDQGD